MCQPSSKTRNSQSRRQMKPSNLLLAFLLCPFIGTSAFLAPPKNMEMIRANNGEPRIRDSTEKIHLLDGKMLLKIQIPAWTPSAEKSEEDAAEEQVCAKGRHQNASLLHSISKSTGHIVNLPPDSHFDVVFCDQQDEGQQCVLGASCASVYRWAPALVRHQPQSRLHAGFVADHVLVPVNCLCVLRWAEKFGGEERKGPIVLE